MYVYVWGFVSDGLSLLFVPVVFDELVVGADEFFCDFEHFVEYFLAKEVVIK